ncbi:MAG TPA: NAD(P)H-hydrate dehydratase [Nevskiaceae bacterium]|nr:NAD(P)H-hydrate dehydratase [Nevskiaceae bacterium]
MGEQPPRFYSSAQVRELDRRAIEDYSIPAYTLMQRAASAAWKLLRERWPKARAIHVVAGPGNNGGDGYEVARLAKAAGIDARVWQIGPIGSGAASQAAGAWRSDGGATGDYSQGCLADAHVIVDSLLGIGVTRPVDGVYAAAVDEINARHAAGAGVLAIDLPSGLDAESGRVWGAGVRADITATFIGRKLGLHTGAGPVYAGQVVLDGLGVPDAVFERVEPLAVGLEPAELARFLPRRARGAHKGDFGHVLVVGGDEGMGGAVLMAARAALRVGAGLVSIATHPAHASALIAAQPELMGRGVRNAKELAPLMKRATVIALGPGLGMTDWGRELWAHVVAAEQPLVVDADALNWLAQNHQRRDNWVLTPHPGEAARLLGSNSAEIQMNRPSSIASIQEKFGGVVALKGAGTLVRGKRLAVCAHGNPGMAAGGMGDVLTGVIAGLLAQGLAFEDAARCGVLLHAISGDRAATVAERGLLPSDVIGALRHFANP